MNRPLEFDFITSGVSRGGVRGSRTGPAGQAKT